MPVSRYTTEQLHKMSERHRRMTGKLPTLQTDPPVPVPEQPLRNTAPSMVEKLWANRWNLVRHFIVDGGGAAIAAFTATKDLSISGVAFVVGGAVGAARKGLDDVRRSDGKADMVTSVLRPKLKGDGMSIRSDVYDVQDKLAAIGIKLTDDVPNKDQLAELLGEAVGLVTESLDFADIPQDQRLHAIAHAFIGAGNKIMDEAKYSDEVTT
jgi:hypothetical protein